MPRKILILGGARFHGLQLAEHFCNAGDDIYVLNRGKYRPHYNSGINHLIADRNNTGQLKRVLNRHRFDVVIDNNAYNPSHIKSVLNLIRNTDLHYILTSSAAVYMRLSSHHKLREGEATGIQEGFYPPKIKDYASDKFAAENALRQNTNNLNYTILRFPNIFGEGDFAAKLSYFYNRLKEEKKILLEEEITKFSIIYVRDVIKIFNALVQNESCYGKTLNVADPREYCYDEFFGTIYGLLYSQERRVLATAKKMWDSGCSLPFAWGPRIDISLSEKLIGKIEYTPLATWGKRALKWEIEQFKDKTLYLEYKKVRELELRLIEDIDR